MSESFNKKYARKVEKLLKDITTYQKALDIFKEHHLNPAMGYYVIYNRDKPTSCRIFSIIPSNSADIQNNSRYIKTFAATKENVFAYNNILIEYLYKSIFSEKDDSVLDKYFAPFYKQTFEKLKEDFLFRLSTSKLKKKKFIKNELKIIRINAKENSPIIIDYNNKIAKIFKRSNPLYKDKGPTFKKLLRLVRAESPILEKSPKALIESTDRVRDWIVYREWVNYYIWLGTQLEGKARTTNSKPSKQNPHNLRLKLVGSQLMDFDQSFKVHARHLVFAYAHLYNSNIYRNSDVPGTVMLDWKEIHRNHSAHIRYRNLTDNGASWVKFNGEQIENAENKARINKMWEDAKKLLPEI